MKNTAYTTPINSNSIKAVLDTNVIYPIIIRDILFWLAHYDLFKPKWSKDIFDEWKNVMLRKNIPSIEIEKRLSSANQAFPDAKVSNYKSILKKLNLPDENDIHVLAVAIKSKSNIIVTNNLKDFPTEQISKFAISINTPDEFIYNLIFNNTTQSTLALEEMISHKKRPPISTKMFVESLSNIKLFKTQEILQELKF